MHRRLSFCIFLLIIGLISDFCDGMEIVYFTHELSSQDGKCLLGDGRLKEVDETWEDDELCNEFKCMKDDDGQFLMHVRGCLTGIPSDCKEFYEGESTRYPDCCPKIECPSEK